MIETVRRSGPPPSSSRERIHNSAPISVRKYPRHHSTYAGLYGMQSFTRPQAPS